MHMSLIDVIVAVNEEVHFCPRSLENKECDREKRLIIRSSFSLLVQRTLEHKAGGDKNRES